MSVEIFLTQDNEFACQWGWLLNSECSAALPIHHLVLVTPDELKRILLCGPEEHKTGPGVISASAQDGRAFVHLDRDGRRWSWECFEAHWWDGEDFPIMVGRWPD